MKLWIFIFFLLGVGVARSLDRAATAIETACSQRVRDEAPVTPLPAERLPRPTLQVSCFGKICNVAGTAGAEAVEFHGACTSTGECYISSDSLLLDGGSHWVARRQLPQ